MDVRGFIHFCLSLTMGQYYSTNLRAQTEASFDGAVQRNAGISLFTNLFSHYCLDLDYSSLVLNLTSVLPLLNLSSIQL